MRLACLLLLVAAASADGTAPAQDACQVRVERGRARLVHGEEIAGLAPGMAARTLEAGDYLELGARSAVELAWRRRASARIAGPAALEVTPTGELRLARFGRAELEVRRGTVALSLPSGGRLDLGASAVELASASAGAVELYHRGGEPVRWSLAGGEPCAGVLRPGERLRLAGAPTPLSAALPRAP